MGIDKRKATTGSRFVDNEIDRIWSKINSIGVGNSSSVVVANTNILTTDLGATAYKVSNLSGILLRAGYIVQVLNGGITVATEDSRSAFAVVYKDIPPYSTTGYVITNGPCMVYFNANGSTAGESFRMSKTNDTVNDDTCKCESVPIQSMDTFMMMGHVWQTRTGEGLAKCIKIR